MKTAEELLVAIQAALPGAKVELLLNPSVSAQHSIVVDKADSLRVAVYLAEVFDRIVAMVRERKVLAGKADALTSEGKMQAMVVGLLPYGFLFAMIKVNPDLMQRLSTTDHIFRSSSQEAL